MIIKIHVNAFVERYLHNALKVLRKGRETSSFFMS